MEFPLKISFKLLALAPQLAVTDANETTIAYVQQKLFKLKEAVTVYTAADKRQMAYEINADRMLDFAASYHFRAADGRMLGAVRRRGLRSLWRAHYEVAEPDGSTAFEIEEANPWTKMLDGLLGSIPVVEWFTGYFLHPSYNVLRDGQAVVRMTKQPALWEGRFVVERLQPLSPDDEERILLSLLMMVLLERDRG